MRRAGVRGGHVVLPLLQAAVVEPGWTDDTTFLAGYGVAQALPGPLFTFAACLGALVDPVPRGTIHAGVALVGIFVPGLPILVGALPFWETLRARPAAQAALRGGNAAVVGILSAALYNPVWVSAVVSPYNFAIVAAGFTLTDGLENAANRRGYIRCTACNSPVAATDSCRKKRYRTSLRTALAKINEAWFDGAI
jgi:chromate transport protein ChrA